MDNRNPEEVQQEIRQKLEDILGLLRQEAFSAGHTEKARAIKIAITQLEVASMCIIRSFFAEKPYSPLTKLQEVK